MKKNYAIPTLKVVEFKVERGFADSGFSASAPDGGVLDFVMNFGDGEEPRNEAYTFDDGTTFWN